MLGHVGGHSVSPTGFADTVVILAQVGIVTRVPTVRGWSGSLSPGWWLFSVMISVGTRLSPDGHVNAREIECEKRPAFPAFHSFNEF
jgi:hypothetical protein